MALAPYRGKNATAIGAIRQTGPCALCVQEGYMNKEDFVWYIDTVLGPTLREGDIVVMDNLRSHTSAEARQALEGWGATALFLPPYSPEYNPIEFCWGIMKAWFRELPNITKIDAIMERVVSLWDRLRGDHCAKVIKHCGYAARMAST